MPANIDKYRFHTAPLVNPKRVVRAARPRLGLTMIGFLAASISAFAHAVTAGAPPGLVHTERMFQDAHSHKLALQHALTVASTSPETQTLDIRDLVWLAAMSDRLAQRLPNPLYRVRLLKIILNEARANGLDPQLVLAVIDVESSFARDALSKSGAVGLMQVMPFWRTVYGLPNADLSNPLVSVRFGCNILRHYMDRYDNVRNALAAYNGSLGYATYPDRVVARYRARWQYAANDFDSLSLAANTRPKALEHATLSSTLGTLVLPASQTALTLRAAPMIIELDAQSDSAQSAPADDAPTAALESQHLSENAVARTLFATADLAP